NSFAKLPQPASGSCSPRVLRGGVSPPGAGRRKEKFGMRFPGCPVLLAASVAAFALGLVPGKTARAHPTDGPEGPRGSLLADTLPPIIPLHHHHLWFSYQYNPANPVTGFLMTLQLNDQGGNCTETLPLPLWLNCNGGDVESPSDGAGV